MMKLAVTGWHSSITRQLFELLGPSVAATRFECRDITGAEAERFLFCHGLLHGVPVGDNTVADESFKVNFTDTASAIDRILENNPRARICVLGSESGIAGSYDMAYAGAKAALHLYVETKRLRNTGQQLVCIAPNVIVDAGMTTRRLDMVRLSERARRHPKGRFCTSMEVARLIHFLLYEDAGYISNVVIRMNGGEHAAR